MNIAGARWHIDYQVVQFIPVHICYKLPDRTARHWSAPYHSVLFIYKQTYTHQLDPKFFQGHDHPFSIHLLHHWPFAPYSKHDGHTWAINIRIHQTDLSPAFRYG